VGTAWMLAAWTLLAVAVVAWALLKN